jgi:PPOX class probable F420-dependent enzyme
VGERSSTGYTDHGRLATEPLPAAPDPPVNRRSPMLDESIAALAEGANFCCVTTFMPDGSAQTLPLWIGVDADRQHLLINTEVHRQRAKNLRRDPRVTVCIVENGNWYRWAEVRGRVVAEITGDEARAHIDDLARTYTGTDYANPIQSERIVFVVEADRQIPPA